MSKRTSTFTAAPGLYEIKGKQMDVRDQIHCRMAQLEAMLAMTYAEPGEAFRGLNDSLQDNFMWSCGMAIKEIQQLWGILTDETREGV
ncbi:hypothetical protein [Azovibrio restrictus]|uniref:hypothetical protein n=1 Tax=Azovibrio restrictus TaxID=146938 RepID=UPI0026EAC511|nr:hypothetical protein [Azovibrio restrictus]MDD3481830.1 hypothetical protein [Azovibrio restrictus]